MSNCITINGLELLPTEDTLLIHYSITCTGMWYLQQLSTAYRNVCDSEWTVMYPNHQHPRHSDFPIAVPSVPYPATFAWNYGGIQGITSESFDAQHSYLVQLSIFNYDCFNTGQTVTGQNTGQPVLTGSTGQPSSTGQPGGGSNPGGGNPWPSGPGTPWPGGGGWPGGGAGGGNPGGGSGPRPPTTVPGIIPGPNFPTPFVPQGIPPRPVPPGSAGGSAGGSGGSGSGIPPDPQLGQYQYVDPVTQPGGGYPNVTQVGSRQQGNVTTINNNSYLQGLTFTYERPSSNQPGQTQNPNLNFTSINVSESVPGQTTSNLNNLSINSRPDLNSVNTSNEGSVPGLLSSKLIGASVAGSNRLNQINTSTLESSAELDLRVANNQVTKGQPIVLSCFFRPTVPMKARIVLSVQDNNKSVEVSRTSLLDVSTSVPLTCGTSTLSSIYNLGSLVATCLVYDQSDAVIGIKSILISNIEEVNNGLFQSSKTTVSENLHPTIINHGNLSTTPVELELPRGISKYLILTADSAQASFSSVLQTDNSTKSLYSLSVYTPQNEDSPIDESIFSGQYISLPSRAYSEGKYTLNGEAIYPDTHSVGMANATIPSTNIVVLEVAPSILNAGVGTLAKLYCPSAFSLREASGVSNATTITGYMPYGNETYGLVIHGKSPDIVPATYVARLSYSSLIGVTVWSGLALTNGDYYSIVETRNNKANPFANTIYQGLHRT